LICGRSDLSSKYETKNQHIRKLELIDDKNQKKNETKNIICEASDFKNCLIKLDYETFQIQNRGHSELQIEV
jgi:hypothetical protein